MRGIYWVWWVGERKNGRLFKSMVEREHQKRGDKK
jgi:hypothetical protein